MTVVVPSGNVDPDAGAQAPGVAPGKPPGVDQETTAPALLVATTCDAIKGMSSLLVTLAPVRVAPLKSVSTGPFGSWQLKVPARSAPERFAPDRLAAAPPNLGKARGMMKHDANTPVRLAFCKFAPTS